MRTPSPLRIALISEHASPAATIGGVDAGGQNVYVRHVACQLARAGHQVDVLTRRDDAELPTSIDIRPGVRVLHIDAGPAAFVPKERLLPHMDEFSHGAAALLRHSLPYDVLHANFFMSGLVGLSLRRRFAVPLVTTFHALGRVRRLHQGADDGFPAVRGEIEQRLVDESDCVVAECPQDRLDLMRLYGARAERIRIVPCGVDLAEFAPVDRDRARRQLGLDPRDFVMLQLGRLVPRKGVDTVIEALARIGSERRVRLLVVGGESPSPDERLTPEIGRLRQLARRLGVEARVGFLGQRQRQDLAACYAAADVFVSTPWYEPFGITPLEAMACGTPVIGSAVGGIQHTVQDGVTGFLVPPRDPATLAERVVELQASPALSRAFGRAGMRRVRSLFTWDRVASQLESVYRSVAGPRRRRDAPALALAARRADGPRGQAAAAAPAPGASPLRPAGVAAVNR